VGEKGTKVVPSTLSEDKRSFTANIFGNAAGKVIGHHQIFAGRTTQSLPDIDIGRKYEERYLFRLHTKSLVQSRTQVERVNNDT
jgi:hypothetical protein